MGSELNIAVTDRELAFRSSIFSELRGVEKREFSCSSCGNIIAHNSRSVHSHPIFGILQCENCKNYFKTVTFSLDSDDAVRYCHICGRERSSSYSCSKPNCPYEFCKTCIKRNVPQSLVDAESGEWKCFACNTKPLWKLRGACAAIMNSLPKRTKSKKGKRETSSDDFVEPVVEKRPRSKTIVAKSSTTVFTLCDSSEDETENEAETRNDKREKLSTRKKMPATNKKSSRKLIVDEHLPLDSSDSDDSGTRELKRSMPTAFAKQPKTNENGNPSSSRRKDGSNADESNNRKSSRGIAKKSTTEKPSNPPAKITKRKSRRSESIESTDSRPVTETKSTTKKSSNPPAKIANRNSRRSESIESTDSRSVTEANYFNLPIRNVSIVLSDIAKDVDKTSRRTYDYLKDKKQGSDSSSGKEFYQSKVTRKSKITLRRNQDHAEARAISPPDSSNENECSESPRDQSVALKESTLKYLTDMEISAKKLLDEIAQVKTKYCTKNKLRAPMRPDDVAGLMKETKNVRSTYNCLVERSAKAEARVTECYDGWCTKSRRENIWKTPTTHEGPNKRASKRATTNLSNINEDSDCDSSHSSRGNATKNNTGRQTESPESHIADGKSSIAVSDCDVDEIFSDEETRLSINRSNATSPNKRTRDRSPTIEESAKPGGEECARKLIFSFHDKTKKVTDKDEGEEDEPMDVDADVEVDEAVEILGKPESPTMSQFSGRSDVEEEPQTKKSKKQRSKSATPPAELDESIGNPQSPDIFETSVECNGDQPSSDETNSDKPSTYQNEIDRMKKASPFRRKKTATNSKTVDLDDEVSSCTVQDDSRKQKSTKDPSRRPSIVVYESEDSGENSKEQVDHAEGEEDDLAEEAVTNDRDTEETVVQNPASLYVDVPSSGTTTDVYCSFSPSSDENTEKPAENREDSLAEKNENESRSEKEEDEIRDRRTTDSPGRESVGSSDTSEGANERAKRAMLMTSSEDSSGEESYPTPRLHLEDSNDPPSRIQESDARSNNSSDSSKENSAAGDDYEAEKRKSGDADKTKNKRNKFRIEKNRYYMEDKKFQLKCDVQMTRLTKKILKRHSRALKKSARYVESKEIERLVDLDRLGKDRKTTAGSSEDDEDVLKNLRRGTRKSRAQEREATLMDHLRKVGSDEDIVIGSGSEDEGSASDKNERPKNSGNNLLTEADRLAKEQMLASSDSDSANKESSNEEDDDENDEKSRQKKKKAAKKEKSDNSSDDEEKREKADKARWRRNKLLTSKLSDSDSEEDRQKFMSSEEKRKKSKVSDSEEEPPPKKKRARRRVLHSDSDLEVSPISNSDSDASDSSTKQKKKKKKKKKSSSSDGEVEEKRKTRKRTRRGRNSSESSVDEKRPKQVRRKRIKMAGSDSDSEEEFESSQGSPGKSGRKNIRKVLRDKQVAEDTKQAAKDEEERLRRIAERQKLYNDMYETRLAGEEKVETLVLDFNEETKEPLVSVHEDLVKRLKPHQAKGIKFMWDACFESLERTKSTKGSGCILAHCMGLGKSFQVVTLAHTLLMHEETGIQTILVVCPLSTVLNWVNEFRIWLADMPSDAEIEVYEMTRLKVNSERRYKLEEWQRTGGVMVIGYEMFRNLSNTSKNVRKNIQESFLRCLVDPGADLVVCDEGHLLKKEDTALCKAMRRVKTLRRIVLTGTPLQNNLIEYHCMVQFVKPNLLGTKKEFTNRFENPIMNGQFDDSTEYDVKLMKKRAHVLHKMLEGSVQRFDYSVLTPFLPPKQEYVIFVKLTKVQINMYQHYLDNYARRHAGVGGSLFADFQALQRIWTHPLVIRMNAEKVDRANEKKRDEATDSEGSLRDFIDDGSDSAASSASSDIQSVSGSDDENPKKAKRGTRANPVAEEPEPAPETAPEETKNDATWWTQFIEDDEIYEDLRISSKLLILFRILKESEQIGDKILVFSQSLYSLTLIEKFLAMIDDATQKNEDLESLDGHTGNWSLGLDYFRLDGQTSADNRRLWCNVFNRPTNTRARLFLISTRAGGLGINLTAANRVIIFDASWNPSHDVQSIFRIYRFGQKKPCYVYRLLAAGTMEEKIYNRQVTKLSLSCRVVDEQQIGRHYSNNTLSELYKLELPSEEESTLNLPKDRVLAEIFLKYKHVVSNYHEHDSLLENQEGEELDEEERQQAWLEYEQEKKGRLLPPPMSSVNYQDPFVMQQINLLNSMAPIQNPLSHTAMLADLQKFQRIMQKDYPGSSEEQQKQMATKAVYDMYNYYEKQTMAGHSRLPMMNLPVVGAGQFGVNNHIHGQPQMRPNSSAETLALYQQSLAQAQNGQMNQYSINQGQIRDVSAVPRRGVVPGQAVHTPRVPTNSSVDDDIIEVPTTADRNSVPSSSAPGVSGKRKEE